MTAAGSRRPGPPRTGPSGSLPLGRVAGVPLAVHWSAAVTAGLLAWGLATGVLPAASPGRPGWCYALAGGLTAVAFLGGLLAHELAHAAVARRRGVEVGSITLWLLGGVAELRAEAPDPGSELRIAGAGPAVSLLLGVGSGALAEFCAALGVDPLAVTALAWLGGTSVLLAVFNLVPGSPLDGGRVLRAVLWRRGGDRRAAAVTAARVGRGVGTVLVVAAVGGFLVTGRLVVLWTALVGWFVVGAAGAEERAARTSGLLAGLRVRDVMSPWPDTVAAGTTVADFVDHLLLTRRHPTVPVVVDGRPVGLLTLARVRAVAPGARARTRVAEVACPMDEVTVAAPDEPLADLVPRLNRSPERRALVLVDGVLVGIVSAADVTRAVEQAQLRGQGPEVARR